MKRGVKRIVVSIVILVMLASTLAFGFAWSNRLKLSFTLVIDAADESEKLDGQTLEIEGYVINLPFRRVHGRGRVTIGEHVLRISRFSFVANIMNLRDIYSWSLFNDEWRKSPSGPATGSGSIVGHLKEGRIEVVTLVLQFPKHNRSVQLKAYPAP